MENADGGQLGPSKAPRRVGTPGRARARQSMGSSQFAIEEALAFEWRRNDLARASIAKIQAKLRAIPSAEDLDAIESLGAEVEAARSGLGRRRSALRALEDAASAGERFPGLDEEIASHAARVKALRARLDEPGAPSQELADLKARHVALVHIKSGELDDLRAQRLGAGGAVTELSRIVDANTRQEVEALQARSHGAGPLRGRLRALMEWRSRLALLVAELLGGGTAAELAETSNRALRQRVRRALARR